MTYEERERQICGECRENVKCPYIPRKLEYKCQNLSDTMYGWELGCKDTIERVCEYIKNNHADIFIRYIRGYDADDEIEIFRKYMENDKESP